MNTYMYKAAFLCEPCGDTVKADPEVIAKRDTAFPAYDPDDEYTWDSDVYPKGPDEAGESDYPDHCDICGVFLENPLTSDGVEYVREATSVFMEHGEVSVLATWADFYADALRETL